MGRVNVLDGQGGRVVGGRQGGRRRPADHHHNRPLRVRTGRTGRGLGQVGRGAGVERGLSGGRGAPDLRGNVARHGASRHSAAAGLVLRHRVRRGVVRAACVVRVRAGAKQKLVVQFLLKIIVFFFHLELGDCIAENGRGTRDF